MCTGVEWNVYLGFLSGLDVGGPMLNGGMEPVARAVAGLDALAASALGAVFDTDAIRRAEDDDLLDAAALAARLHRRLEGFLAETIAEMQNRSSAREHGERITTTHGCRAVSELVQRVTLCSAQTAAVYVRVADGIRRDIAPSSGETLPPDLPALRQSLLNGDLGVEGVHAVLGPLRDLRIAVGASLTARAEEQLAEAARGTNGPPAGWHDLRLFAQVLVAYLDPDGAEPREDRALRRRGVTLASGADGLVALRGRLLPEVAAQLQRIFDSILNPKVAADGAEGPQFVDSSDLVDERFARGQDSRTRAQKQHDALATALGVAARAGELPTIGGAAPTLVVSVREQDLARGTGVADVEGADQPVSIDVARQVACAGAIERVVFGAGGRIRSLEVVDRVFTFHQRRAIALRDGNCIIPGCGVPASWCEIHHVQEHARGGPTHTDNGVLLCWFHHRTLDDGQWQVRMNAGVPEVRGPHWWDEYRRWRPVTTSRVRRIDRLSG